MRLKYVEFTSPVVNPKEPHGMRRSSFSAEGGPGLDRQTVAAVDIDRDESGVVTLATRGETPVVFRSNVPCIWVEWPADVTPIAAPAPAPQKAAK